MKCKIYRATNLLTGKCYIGQTIQTLENRISEHKYDSFNREKDSYFYKSIRKHGIENFKWEVLCECETIEIMNIIETFMIMVHKSHVSESGYNLTWGGEGSYGRKISDKTRIKMSESGKIKNFTDSHRKHLSEATKKRKHPDSVKKKIGEGNRGKIRSEETKRKISETKRKINEEKKKNEIGKLSYHGKCSINTEQCC